MNCDYIIKGEIAEKCLLGELNEADQEAYEQHYFECPRCFEELQTCRALQLELKRAAPSIRAEPSRPRRSYWGWAWAPTAVLAMIAAGLGWWVWRARIAPMQMPAPAVQTRTPKPVPKEPVPSMAVLARVRPPAYVPAVLRGPEDEATQRFQAAMRHYVRAEYAAAIPSLRVALKLSPQASNINFYLGICYLMTDQTEAAIKRLRNTVALGDSPYLEDSHFYLAKCYLRIDNPPAARIELEKTAMLRGERETEARELLQQVEALKIDLR